MRARIFSLVVLCFSVLFVLAISVISVSTVRAIDPIDDIQNQINQIAHLRQLSIDATTPLENQVKDLQSRIDKARADLKNAQLTAQNLGQSIAQQEVELASQYQVFSHRVGERYKRSYLETPLLTLLSSSDATNLTRNLMYRQSVEQQDNQVIHTMGSKISSLETQKKNWEQTQARLASLSNQLNDQVGFFQTEIGKAKAYQQQLTGQIAALSAKQQDILNSRSGSITTSVGNVPPADDFNASIEFKPQAPSDSFAVFSFGAYTHRKGMSQYGAKGRAMSGQSYTDILQAYYGKQPQHQNTDGDINVAGAGRINFETTYLYGVAEMPSSYPMEALKVQAIASRTYAYRYKQSGETICVVDGCPGQVWLRSKSNNPPAEWKAAVDATKGQIIPDVVTYFSATTGGYAVPVGWDTKCGNQGCWTGDAYEKIGGSPWFYRAWYRQDYYNSSNSCGRAHPWLSQQEFSDIINAWIVRKNPNGADVSRIQPITINQCNVGGGGGNPYSMDELRDKAGGSGGAVTHVSSVTVSNNGSGQTTNVHLETNRGGLDIPGDEFKTTFNLRAPGFLSIPQQSFAFFNVEHKE